MLETSVPEEGATGAAVGVDIVGYDATRRGRWNEFRKSKSGEMSVRKVQRVPRGGVFRMCDKREDGEAQFQIENVVSTSAGAWK